MLRNSSEALVIGHHTVFDVYDCAAGTLEYTSPAAAFLNEAVAALGLGKVAESYKQFEPVGATGIILLEESHISIHTWPEHNFAAIDIFSCRPFDIGIISEIITRHFKASQINTKVIERGHIPVAAVS